MRAEIIKSEKRPEDDFTRVKVEVYIEKEDYKEIERLEDLYEVKNKEKILETAKRKAAEDYLLGVTLEKKTGYFTRLMRK